MRLPKHTCGLYITHNAHKDVYETVLDTIKQAYDDDHWVSPEERQRAIETNELWTLQWYPDTPVGFYRLQASTWNAIEAAIPADAW